jgi:hypothetical protein
MPAGGLLTAAAIGSAGAGFLESRKKSKFRQPKLPSLSELVSKSVEAFKSNQQQFLSSQISAQQSQFQPFFDRQGQALKQGDSLIAQLTEGDLQQRQSTQQVRSAQAARGLSLSPAAAVQEGLQASQAQFQNEGQALQLQQQLAQFSAQTPLELQQLNFSQLLGTGGQLAGQKAGFDAQQQLIKIQQQDASRAATSAGLAKLAGGFGGAAGGAAGGAGFLSGAGISDTRG